MAQQILIRLSLLGLFLSGVACGGRSGSGTHPVHGKVLYKDKPASGAIVVFHPVVAGDDKDPALIRPSGIADDTGAFYLTSVAPKDGAPAGKYRVAITLPTPPPAAGKIKGMGGNLEQRDQPDQLKGKYSDPRSTPLPMVEVTAGENHLAPFELK